MFDVFFYLQDTLRYSFANINNFDQVDRTFFYINPDNGYIILKSQLTETTLTQFQVHTYFNQGMTLFWCGLCNIITRLR